MHIISFRKLREYFEKETNAKVAMQDWYKKAKKSDWDNFSDLKNTFNSTDSVGNNRYVFNVKGNHYRIIAIIRFDMRRIFIRWVGNHSNYNKIKNIDAL